MPEYHIVKLDRSHPMLKRISELVPGDLVDLEGDKYADTDPYAHWRGVIEFEYQQVLEIENETPTCICVYFDGITVGFPPEHTVNVEAAS